MAASINDVARAAGVSTATVSRAVRNLPHVSTETRERVQRIAAEMGYTPTPSAASLASGRTRTIGLLTPWINRWFFANVIEGAERYLRTNGFDVLLDAFDIHRDAPRRRVDPGVLRRRVDGILVVGLPRGVRADRRRRHRTASDRAPAATRPHRDRAHHRFAGNNLRLASTPVPDGRLAASADRRGPRGVGGAGRGWVHRPAGRSRLDPSSAGTGAGRHGRLRGYGRSRVRCPDGGARARAAGPGGPVGGRG